MTMEMKLQDAREEGRRLEVLKSVRDGDYSAERGAQKLEIPLEEFIELLDQK